MRISDWSSDVCSSDLPQRFEEGVGEAEIQQVLHSLLAQVMVDAEDRRLVEDLVERGVERLRGGQVAAEGLFHHNPRAAGARSEENTSELQSLMRISYAVFCLKK